MATTGIPLDSACLLAVALEGIVYGEHLSGFLRPIITKLGSPLQASQSSCL